jgi:hypothetical protein
MTFVRREIDLYQNQCVDVRPEPAAGVLDPYTRWPWGTCHCGYVVQRPRITTNSFQLWMWGACICWRVEFGLLNTIFKKRNTKIPLVWLLLPICNTTWKGDKRDVHMTLSDPGTAYMCGCLGKPVGSRWASSGVEQKKMFRDGNISRGLVWSGEVLVPVGHCHDDWPAFEIKFHIYFSYFWYLYAILPKNLSYKKRPDHWHSTSCI